MCFNILNHLGVDHECDKRTDKTSVSIAVKRLVLKITPFFGMA